MQVRSPVRLRVYAYAEWVLGTNRARSAPYIVPSLDAGDRRAAGAQSLQPRIRRPRGVPRQRRRPAFGHLRSRTNSSAHEAASNCRSWCAAGAALSGTVEAGARPMRRDRARHRGRAGRRSVAHLSLLGDAGSQEEASALVAAPSRPRFRRTPRRATKRTGTASSARSQVETPDKAFNAMVNHWLPYQSLACRIRARSAFYQASGAFGFRDQLQDTLAFLLHDPSLAPRPDPQRRARGSSRKATCSIGGCRAPAPACAR